jgi:hypothetical protein
MSSLTYLQHSISAVHGRHDVISLSSQISRCACVLWCIGAQQLLDSLSGLQVRFGEQDAGDCWEGVITERCQLRQLCVKMKT